MQRGPDYQQLLADARPTTTPLPALALSCPPSQLTLLPVQRGPDYQQLLADAQGDLDRQRREADEHAAMLRQDAQRAQSDASAARSEARVAAAGADFEREGNERLGAQLRDQAGQLEATMAGNTKLQVPCRETFVYLSSARARGRQVGCAEPAL